MRYFNTQTKTESLIGNGISTEEISTPLGEPLPELRVEERYDEDNEVTICTVPILGEYDVALEDDHIFFKPLPEGKVIEYDHEGLPYLINKPPVELSLEDQRKKSLHEGVEFEGVMCSAFKEDQWGLASLKEYIMAGNDVDFLFENENTLTLTPDNLAAFEAVWIPFRQAHTKNNFTGS